VAGRLQLIRLIESGCSLRSAAAQSAVSSATAHRWWHRWQQATDAERASRSCLRARPPIPRSCPWRLDPDAEQRILDARARTNYGPARLAGLVGYRRSTVWKVLARHGVSRRRRVPRERSSRRYEWAEPGALLHMDTKRLVRFDRPGIGRPVIARAVTAAQATSTHTASSMTTAAWPTSSCTAPTPATRPRSRCAAPPPGCASRAPARPRR
jgi:hypothetical protein